LLLAALAVLFTGPAAMAYPHAVAGAGRVSLTTPPTVTRGAAVTLHADLSVAGVAVPGRPVTFTERRPGATDWSVLGTVDTDVHGASEWTVSHVDHATEFGAYYSDAEGVVGSPTATATVHVVDIALHAPSMVRYDAHAVVAAALQLDGTDGIAGQQVRVRYRSDPGAPWSASLWRRSSNDGGISATRRAVSSFQVGVDFPGNGPLAASPLRITTVHVRMPWLGQHAVSADGFRFPFLDPAKAESRGAWSLDQGVDLAAKGTACGSAAKLVAVDDGTVIQTGVSGFGPTAPVIRMSDGPFAGRNVYYGHTGHIYVHVGQRVHRGQLVAQIGCGHVGESASPHLEIGVGEPGGPPCCPPFRATAGEMLRELVDSLDAAR
jgi:murein DD-endopeptidase MepM/ murein hydrolase activator NlpD